MLMVRFTSKPGRGKELAQLLQPVPKDNDIDGCFGMDILENSQNQEEILIIGDGELGDWTSKVRDTLVGIQLQEIDDPFGWVITISEQTELIIRYI